MAKRRWGGFFSVENIERFGRGQSRQAIATQGHPHLDAVFETPQHGDQQRHSTTVTPNLNEVDDVTRRASLSRSNAICHRRSRAVSDVSTDSSTASNIGEARSRWSSSSYSSDEEPGPSTAATTPLEQTAPDDAVVFALSLEDILALPSPREALKDRGQPLSEHERTGSVTNFLQVPASPKVLRPSSSTPELTGDDNTAHSNGGVQQPDTSESRKRLADAYMRIALLEEENKRLKRQLLRSTKSDGPQPNTGAVSQLIERWIDTMQDTQRQPKNRNSLEEEKRALETKVRELEAKIALKDCSIQTFLDMIKQIAKVAGKKTDEMPIHGLEGHVYPLSPKQTEELLTCFGGSVTPRKLVLLRLGQQQEKPTGDHDGQTKQGIPSALDVPLRLDQAAQFVRGLETRSDLLATGGITMKACSICRVPKLLNNSLSQPPSPLSHSSTLDSLNEFHPRFGRTSCCSKHICNTCLPPAIISSVTRDWWHRLPDPYWLRCPTPDCQASLPLRYNVDMTNVLRSLGDPDVLTHVRLFERATLLRTTLEGLPETPTPEALARAADLHAQLATHGRAHPFFDMHRGMSGMKVELLPVDSTDGSRSLRVPVFTSLLVRGRQTTGRRLGAAPFERECAICAESVPDVTDGTPGDEAAWSAATRGFPGDWARLVRAFPTPALLPECSGRHALDACRGCLARHLEASLEALGRAGCDRLSCPSPGCGHVYTHAQLAALATSETFARYDRFRLLSVLAALPNFRWCLREGCGSGQIYDGVPSAAPQPQPQPPPFGLLAAQLAGASGSAGRVACDACGFEMCFAHQTPWHAGLSCAAYDRQLRGGRGPAEEQREEAATRAWIAAHTKACPGPGCGVPVEKKGGCFHMTCRACRFEFCWECLADWGGIQRRATPPAAGGVARRRYERLGHNEGCFFRDLGAPLPTMITGNDIEEATRGL